MSSATPKDSKAQSLEGRALAAEARIDIHLRETNGATKALQAAIEALELLMQACAQASPERKMQLKAKFNKLMTRAEEIKRIKSQEQTRPTGGQLEGAQAAMARVSLSSPEPPAPSTSSSVLSKAPQSNRTLSVEERTIILRSSVVVGHKFPPWTSDPIVSEFDSRELFTDTTGKLPLSDAQTKILDRWKRPSEIHDRVTVVPEKILDLAQDAITDCSIVASMCAAASREEKGHSKIVSNIIYPQDQNGKPLISGNGKYIVKLYFNGSHRKVIIDDYLPVSKNSRALHVVCRANPTLIWPALVEKAYLKVMGGYDFPGSNSGTDLLALTGWIPEHVFLQSDGVEPASLWKRIYKAWGFGDVLITLGTGVMTHHEEEELGLASEHDYAVLELKEIDGRRLMLVKNPWSEGTIWKGGLSHLDSDSEDENDDNDDDDDDDEEPEEWTEWDESMALPAPTGEGQFWIDLDHTCRHFANIYLNWNPELFFYRYDHHFAWDLQRNGNNIQCKASFTSHPQFSIANPSETKSATVWLLLQRHIQGQLVAMGGPRAGYISLYVFENNGKKVYISDGALIRGPYVDSPQTLLRLDAVPPCTTYTVVVSSQDLVRGEHSFTLSAFSDYPLKTAPSSDIYPHQRTLASAWLPHNAGGNARSPTYSTNPQFKLTIPPTTTTADLMLQLESRDELSVHVKLVWGGGRRVATVMSRDIIAESGEYRRGCALAEVKSLSAGEYTIVASTFERGQVGDFILRVRSNVEIGLESIRAETAGKLTRTVAGAWPAAVPDHQAQTGSAHITTLAFPISAPRLTRLCVIATSTWGSGTEPHNHSPPLLRLFLQRRLSQHYLSRFLSRHTYLPPDHQQPEVLGTSGPGWSDAPQGVRTGDVDVEGQTTQGGMWEYWAVLQRMGGGSEGYEVLVLADGFVDLGQGITVEGTGWPGEGSEV